MTALSPSSTPKPEKRTVATTQKREQKLAKLGLIRDIDWVLHLPLRYEDETRLTPIAALFVGNHAQVQAEVIDQAVQYRPRRQLQIQIQDASGDRLTLRFLHFYPSHLTQLSVGAKVRVHGQVRQGREALEMVHPTYQLIKIDSEAPPTALPTTLTPVYPTTAGISQSYLRKAIKNALTQIDLPELWTEQNTLQWGMHGMRELHLPTLAQAVQFLHHPSPQTPESALLQHTHPAWQRVKFEELLAQQIILLQAYEKRRAKRAPPMPRHRPSAQEPPSLVTQLLNALPFTLTAAQQRVQREIEEDLSTAHPMQRLLQGDVGSGKTIIAALAAAQAIEAGYQVALMAPTEILVEQHYRKWMAWFTPLGVRIVQLSGHLKPKEKRSVLETIAFGQAQCIIGTHAMIQDAVEFARLGLVIIDEQHRFGVHQRLALSAKAQRGVLESDAAIGTQSDRVSDTFNGHQLMMSATPIPRTLAMSYYADMDVSVIDELPPNRIPVRTKLITQARRPEVIDRVHATALAGRQIYWVCPLIDESDTLELQAAMDTFDMLTDALPDITVGLVHGRQNPEQKADVIERFVSGEVDLLVSTTVIEVGVDVPNASLMIIEHAERFGLAQLHQLRGRVGRSDIASVCVLLYAEPLSWTARARLRTMYETSDGFVIAQRDLALRGPGELLGVRQSGAMLLRFADIEKDSDLLVAAREAAMQLLCHAPAIAKCHLNRWLGCKQAYLIV